MQITKICSVCGSAQISQIPQNWNEREEDGGKRKYLELLLGALVRRVDQKPLTLKVDRIAETVIAMTIGDATVKPLPNGGRFAEPKHCPQCASRHVVPIDFEWPEPAAGVKLLFTSQSSKTDLGRLEWMIPNAPDGQELQMEESWSKDGRCILQITRRPVGGKPPVIGAILPRTRADLRTRAAELQMAYDPKWSTEQLAEALRKHEAALAPVK